MRWPSLPVAPHEPEGVDAAGTLDPAPARSAHPGDEEESGVLDARHVLIGLGAGFAAAMALSVAVVGVGLGALLTASLLPGDEPVVVATAEPTLDEVLRGEIPGEPSLARVLQQGASVAVQPEATEEARPARKARAQTRRRARPAPAPARSDDSVQMSLAELRSYLSGRAEQAAPQQPAPAPAAPPSPAQQASRALSATTPAAVAGLAVGQPEPPKRPSAGRQVVMADGLPPLDPVLIQLDVTGDAAVLVDGQPVIPGTLVVEAGSHEIRVRGSRDEGVFQLTAGEGDAWCFQARGRVKVTSCRR